MNRDEVEAWLDTNEITWVRVEGTNLDGLAIGKHQHRDKFLSSLPEGSNISDVVFALDLGGVPQLTWAGPWPSAALADMVQRPDIATLVTVPNRPGVAAVVCDYYGTTGERATPCGRGLLRTVVDRIAELGYDVRAAYEIEGMLFNDPIADARRRGYRNLTPRSLPNAVAYSLQSGAEQAEFFHTLVERLDVMNIAVEGWHDEAAPGQFELNLSPTDPIAAADAVLRVKLAMRELALELGIAVTFMAKPSEEYGNGLHLHHSLRSRTSGEPVLLTSPGELSDLGNHWLAGLVATSSAATSILCPTINSYRRMVEWAAVPSVPSWGEDNKSATIRTLRRSPSSARFEHRLAAGDANPYLVMAAVLAGGLAGLDQELEPPPPLEISGWGLPESWPKLPKTIMAAAGALEDDTLLTSQLGTKFVDYWIESRRWEWLAFHTDGGDACADSVTDWELNRYFEVP